MGWISTSVRNGSCHLLFLVLTSVPLLSNAGLVVIRSDQQQRSMHLTIFSTASGKLAQGGSAQLEGPFAKAFLAVLKKPQLPFPEALSQLNGRLHFESSGTQSISLTGDWPEKAKYFDNSSNHFKSRVALVIGGNETLHSGISLFSAEREARAIGSALMKVGFATKVVTKLTKDELTDAVQKAAELAGANGVLLVYFSGLGAQVHGVDSIFPNIVSNNGVRHQID